MTTSVRIAALAACLCLDVAPARAQVAPPDAEARKSAALRARRDEILAKERASLKALADRLEAEGKADLAAQVVSEAADAPAADGSTRFLLLAEMVGASRPDPIAGREPIRAEAAKGLFALAEEAARPPSLLALADDALRRVVERQPDHAEARRLLGFVPHKGGWATPYAAKKIAEGWVDDPTYGWVPGSWVPHLGRGELPGKEKPTPRWYPAEQADALRREMASGWVIKTEHFDIQTNATLREGIAFVRKLEALHQLFFGIMADTVDPTYLPLAQRFRSPKLQPSLPPSRKAHVVYYFATREEYADHLAPYQGEGSKISLGTYAPVQDSKEFGGKSYFFNDVGGQIDVESTLYHEASHQLLFETGGKTSYEKNVGQYWVFEGLGTYFETLRHQPDGTLRIGGLVGPRIVNARGRLVDANELVPLDGFVAMNKARFWGDLGNGDIRLHYAEAMALAVYLMQADGQRHREAFLDYARDAYKGQFKNNSAPGLDDRIGMSYREMGRAVLDYLARAPRRGR